MYENIFSLIDRVHKHNRLQRLGRNCAFSLHRLVHILHAREVLEITTRETRKPESQWSCTWAAAIESYPVQIVQTQLCHAEK